MRALVLREEKSLPELVERESPEPGPGEVVVALRAAALNRRDFWITRGLYPGVRAGVTLGSDGAGVVARVGASVDTVRPGDEVIVDPSLGWGDDERAQSPDYRILGMPDDGTFAEEVRVPAGNVRPKPAHLSWEEAAALPLAGLTAYRALFSRGRCAAEDHVLVTGAGGGVATFAIQLAVARGATVTVTSSSPEKIACAVELGAVAGFDYRDPAWTKALEAAHGAPSLIVDSAGGEGYGRLLDLAAPGGRIVNYGATAGAPPKLDLFKVFWKQLDILGSTMGSPADFRGLLALVDARGMRPVVDEVLPLEDAAKAFEKLRDSTQFGKIVLRISG